MDLLVMLAFIVLLSVIVSPIVAFIDLGKSNDAKNEINQLKIQIENSENQLGHLKTASSPPSDPVVSVPEPVPITPDIAVKEIVEQSVMEAETTQPETIQLEPESSQQQLWKSSETALSGTLPSSELSLLNSSSSRPSSSRAVPTTVANETSSNLFSGLIRWFFKDNPVAKLGILLLFFLYCLPAQIFDCW
ncbi:hypothetical protein [Xenorhabdus littoralis]|uniref:hypothetical protein n=1 Tax=Xenorhabdus littoralis TaxID=2582835 RepID=UPI0029E803AE|nr:hypothetical protein [Xenorhabdus sp. psl]MDX7992175.1 hypothetical protein [Xenorhabdus sp. psl]